MKQTHDNLRPIRWENDQLYLLDQRKLPFSREELVLHHAHEVAAAIRDMVVRGAPAIGIAAAYGAVLAVRQAYTTQGQHWREHIETDFAQLSASRPTAVNLNWALARMREALATIPPNTDPVPTVLQLADQIHHRDITDNYAMGEFGADILGEGACILTHCNTGSLATGGYGTALGVIRTAYRRGQVSVIFADETRPWLQGSRLTAWELQQDGIPVTLLPDSAAGSLMQQKKINWVIVGADRITANGDVANKIGTYSLAVLAKYHGVRFMVVAPSSTIDWQRDSGADIPIEQRAAEEVTTLAGQTIAPAGIGAWNPVFDVTPVNLIDAIVTERGAVLEPCRGGLRQLFPHQN
ncbi:S-methyl-5-thioribose-1-phosphate isomerase [Thioflexithrix psekupsensis]|uniref:Methylthioribose-1-phosphate isomerase n=1 Tax=Thioflexithrix psekupsensis TaxID=1570016 RepID=A0A251X5L7_9GAMM|nr:S-methyl-5-thioribose-1-phosphate isomerase [Thioflexithrix psekupsensis]OUD12686.1 S-methyl-5-thioribose-1-phosphate isomerase [Thioflexithrix psekupsensis]